MYLLCSAGFEMDLLMLAGHVLLPLSSYMNLALENLVPFHS
jgi:hypothetical protein